MIGSISGQIKAKAARLDPSSYGRSDTSAVGRWFWEIDKVLLLLIAFPSMATYLVEIRR